MLGDEIMVGCGPNQESLARVVAIGTDLVTDDIDQEFYDWVKDESKLNDNTLIVEWIDVNLLSHDDPQYAPVCNYMTLECVCCETFIRRGRKI